MYDVVLGETWGSRGPLLVVSETDTVSAAILHNELRGGTHRPGIPDDLSPEVREALEDLFSRGRTPQPLVASSLLRTRHQRITPDSVQRMRARLQGVRGSSRLPDSATVVFLSPVGFNRDHTVATVMMGSLCGMLCGGGELRVLRKQRGEWLPAEILVQMAS